MAETAAKPTSKNFLSVMKSPDVQFAVGVFGIILTMILPLPPILLDLLLSISISVSFIVLLVAIYVKEPLDFSTFPTVLLITTLLRLSLNVATTRSILLDAPTGNVSSVISAFGNFVVGGNYFVGFVIFAILVIINFIVITKGAGRVAEVGARFTLDAMPGKQMAIDAELNAGLIDKKEAKRRRTKVETQADFYGAMDGASKFVRGDAIAGIIITAINIIVGLIVGVVIYGMSFSNAGEVFTLLTVGDGLVSQIPALVISTAAGIVVTRAGADERAISFEMSDQFLSHPKALYISSGILALIGIVPGMPLAPFGVLAIACFFIARYASKLMEKKLKEEAERKDAEETEEASPDTIESLLHIDYLALEVGVGLIPLVDNKQDGEVLERIVSTRKQFAQDLGLVVPMVMVRDNIQLKPGEYQLLLKGNPIGKGSLMVDYLLAMDPGDVLEPIDGIPGKEPAYGLDAIWIKASHKEEATFRGYTVVNCSTIIVTHLTKLIEEHAQELIGRQEVQNLVDTLRDEYPKVVEEVLGADRLALGDVVKVLQNLLEEKVNIRDLLTIFETLADNCRTIKNPEVLTRYVRKALGRGIIKKYLDLDAKLTVVTLDRAVEDLMVAGLQHHEDGSTSMRLEPETAQRILNSIATTLESFQDHGSQPLILCGSLVRWELKKLINRFIPGVVVLAFDEIPPGVSTNSIGIVSI
ncbi:MAG: flagellar biosynthesis protein FlhA [Pseudobacteriovorax sp.]|nr:flagellar biosynthesis protein FlhA [Pseudobacteriovorax sp.]